MGLKREGKEVKPIVEPGTLSKSAKAAMIWFLSIAEDDMPMKAARAVIRDRHGLAVEQELRAFVAGLAVKEQTHNVRAVKGERGRYEVESLTNRGGHYLVCIEDMTCPCKGFEVRKWCSHLDSAIAYKFGQEDAQESEIPF